MKGHTISKSHQITIVKYIVENGSQWPAHIHLLAHKKQNVAGRIGSYFTAASKCVKSATSNVKSATSSLKRKRSNSPPVNALKKFGRKVASQLSPSRNRNSKKQGPSPVPWNLNLSPTKSPAKGPPRKKRKVDELVASENDESFNLQDHLVSHVEHVPPQPEKVPCDGGIVVNDIHNKIAPYTLRG